MLSKKKKKCAREFNDISNCAVDVVYNFLNYLFGCYGVPCGTNQKGPLPSFHDVLKSVVIGSV